MAGHNVVSWWFVAIMFWAAIVPQMTALPVQDEGKRFSEEDRIEAGQKLDDLLHELYNTEPHPTDDDQGKYDHLSMEQIGDGVYPETQSRMSLEDGNSDPSEPQLSPYEQIGDGVYPETQSRMSLEDGNSDPSELQLSPYEQIGDGFYPETDLVDDHEVESPDGFSNQAPTDNEEDPQEYNDPPLMEASEMEEDDLFEGDLKIPQELIDAFYGTDGQAHDSAARKNHHWPQAIVYYKHDKGLDTNEQHLIRDAMDHWEDRTCLRFIKRNSEPGYIYYQDTDQGCYSDSIGMNGFKQIINLQGSGCKTIGITIHEIGHAVGFWHEQSRPDRDDYVKINWGNIEDNDASRYQFKKRTTSSVDSKGVVYDYGSIMHYGRDYFSTCLGCPTIEVNNDAEYEKQGCPTIGQRNGLSALDDQQANLVYDCASATGLNGVLKVYVKSARNLPDTDPWWNAPDPFVCLTAMDKHEHKDIKTTSYKGGTTNPTWNQWLTTSAREWRFFRLQILDDDGGWSDHDRMSVSETFIPKEGTHKDLKYCIDRACNGYLYYDYTFTLDKEECAPKPCRNGGTCIELIAKYTCSCTSGWGGTNCELPNKNLKVYVKSGKNLPDEDGWWNDSDPYVEIIAVNSKGTSVRKLTSDKAGNLNPKWNEWVKFGTDTWKSFKIRVWDLDGFFNGSDDPMSKSQTFNVAVGAHTNKKHSTSGGGSITFNYYFE